MSKKQRKTQKQRLSLPMLALIGGVLLVGAAALFAFQSRGGKEVSGTPDIAVSQERIDYGDVKLDTPLTFQFQVTNTGDGTLRIEQDPYLEVVEGC